MDSDQLMHLLVLVPPGIPMLAASATANKVCMDVLSSLGYA